MPQVSEFHVELRAKAAPEMHPFYTVGGKAFDFAW
jgi:hypothetical protein